MAHREQLAECLVRLAITLVDLDCPVVVVIVVLLIGNVLDVTSAAAATQCRGRIGVDARPDLDTRSVAGIRHTIVIDVNVLNNIILLDVLSERSDRDAVASITGKPLYDDIGAVGFERNAVVAVVYHGILNNNAIGTVRVPTICVLGCSARCTVDIDGDVADQDIRCVCDQVEPLQSISIKKNRMKMYYTNIG
jgi:hypothetical protein